MSASDESWNVRPPVPHPPVPRPRTAEGAAGMAAAAGVGTAGVGTAGTGAAGDVAAGDAADVVLGVPRPRSGPADGAQARARRPHWWSVLWRRYVGTAVCSDPRVSGAWVDGLSGGCSIYERGWPFMLPRD